MGIQQHDKVVIRHRSPSLIFFSQTFSGQEYSKTMRGFTRPLFIRHLSPIREQPAYILNFRSLNRTALEKVSTTENWMALSQTNQRLDEFKKVRVRLFPVDPADIVVLAIGIVITEL